MPPPASTPRQPEATAPHPVATAGRPGTTPARSASIGANRHQRLYARRMTAMRWTLATLGAKFWRVSPTRADCLDALGRIPHAAWLVEELRSIARTEDLGRWEARMHARLARAAVIEPCVLAGRAHDAARATMFGRPSKSGAVVVDFEDVELRREVARQRDALTRRDIERDLDEALDRGGRAGVVQTMRVLDRSRALLART